MKNKNFKTLSINLEKTIISKFQTSSLKGGIAENGEAIDNYLPPQTRMQYRDCGGTSYITQC